jgi:hypothetical protein
LLAEWLGITAVAVRRARIGKARQRSAGSAPMLLKKVARTHVGRNNRIFGDDFLIELASWAPVVTRLLLGDSLNIFVYLPIEDIPGLLRRKSAKPAA